MLLVPDGEKPFAPAATSSLVVPLQSAIDAVSNNLASLIHVSVVRQLSGTTDAGRKLHGCRLQIKLIIRKSSSLQTWTWSCLLCVLLQPIWSFTTWDTSALHLQWHAPVIAPGVHLTVPSYRGNCACSELNQSSVGMFCTTCKTCPESMLMISIGDRFQ